MDASDRGWPSPGMGRCCRDRPERCLAQSALGTRQERIVQNSNGKWTGGLFLCLMLVVQHGILDSSVSLEAAQPPKIETPSVLTCLARLEPVPVGGRSGKMATTVESCNGQVALATLLFDLEGCSIVASQCCRRERRHCWGWIDAAGCRTLQSRWCEDYACKTASVWWLPVCCVGLASRAWARCKAPIPVEVGWAWTLFAQLGALSLVAGESPAAVSIHALSTSSTRLY